MKIILLFLLTGLLTGCAAPASVTSPPITVTQTVIATQTVTPTPTPLPPITVTVTASPGAAVAPVKDTLGLPTAGLLIAEVSAKINFIYTKHKITFSENNTKAEEKIYIFENAGRVYYEILNVTDILQADNKLQEAVCLCKYGRLPTEITSPYAKPPDVISRLNLAIANMNNQILIVQSAKVIWPDYTDNFYKANLNSPVPVAPNYRDKAKADIIKYFEDYQFDLQQILDSIKLTNSKLLNN